MTTKNRGWHDQSKRHQIASHGAFSTQKIRIEAFLSPSCPACQLLKPQLPKQITTIHDNPRNFPPHVRVVPTLYIYEDNSKKPTKVLYGASPSTVEELKRIKKLLKSAKTSKTKEYKSHNTRDKQDNTSYDESIQKTGCLQCSISHLYTVSGALKEALRFARTGGMTHPEVLRRLTIANEEITIMERIDLSPEAIENLPPAQKQFIYEIQPEIRKLRQYLSEIRTYEDIEKTYIEAQNLATKMYKFNNQLD